MEGDGFFERGGGVGDPLCRPVDGVVRRVAGLRGGAGIAKEGGQEQEGCESRAEGGSLHGRSLLAEDFLFWSGLAMRPI